MDGWMDGCMYVWMDGWMHACMHAWMDGWMHACMHVYIYINMCVYRNMVYCIWMLWYKEIGCRIFNASPSPRVQLREAPFFGGQNGMAMSLSSSKHGRYPKIA
jgi:hypothetical protein